MAIPKTNCEGCGREGEDLDVLENAPGISSELHGRKFCNWCDNKRDRRERIATAVLAGFAGQNGTEGYNTQTEVDDVIASRARYAVKWADALIAELDKSGTGRE